MIYTSGTTGRPKGVELTHSNLVWNALTMRDGMVDELVSVGCLKTPVRSLAVLPWAHIYGQTLELHGMLAGGHEVALCSDPTQFLDEAKGRPDVCYAVRRGVLYTFVDAIAESTAHAGPRALQQDLRRIPERTEGACPTARTALADKAIALGAAQAKRRYDASLPGPSFVEKIQHRSSMLILKKVSRALGGEVKFCGTAAPLSRRRQRVHRGHRHPDDLRLWLDGNLASISKNNRLTPKTLPVIAGQRSQRRATEMY